MKSISFTGVALAFSAIFTAQALTKSDLLLTGSKASIASTTAPTTAAAQAISNRNQLQIRARTPDKDYTANAVVIGSLDNVTTTESPTPALLSTSVSVSVPVATPTHVDTIHNTTGVPTTEEVANTVYSAWCAANDGTCKLIQNTVAVCIDAKNNCPTNATRDLLYSIVDENPCDLAANGTLTQKLCEAWLEEARRCRNKTRRGPCSTGHIDYILKAWRDLLGLGTE